MHPSHTHTQVVLLCDPEPTAQQRIIIGSCITNSSSTSSSSPPRDGFRFGAHGGGARASRASLLRLIESSCPFAGLVSVHLTPFTSRDWGLLWLAVMPRRYSQPYGSTPKARSSELWAYACARDARPLFRAQLDGCAVLVGGDSRCVELLLHPGDTSRAFRGEFMRPGRTDVHGDRWALRLRPGDHSARAHEEFGSLVAELCERGGGRGDEGGRGGGAGGYGSAAADAPASATATPAAAAATTAAAGSGGRGLEGGAAATLAAECARRRQAAAAAAATSRSLLTDAGPTAPASHSGGAGAGVGGPPSASAPEQQQQQHQQQHQHGGDAAAAGGMGSPGPASPSAGVRMPPPRPVPRRTDRTLRYGSSGRNERMVLPIAFALASGFDGGGEEHGPGRGSTGLASSSGGGVYGSGCYRIVLVPPAVLLRQAREAAAALGLPCHEQQQEQHQPPSEQAGTVPERRPAADKGASSSGPQQATCVVCMCRPASLGLKHGRSVHACACFECARLLIEGAKWPGEPVRCPMCRQAVEEVLAVF
ncbi:hypothetical protein FOA52_013108 [Chlamydomonas sp. UWO 241]|nr:hypothetical protein FOA52_013108 [Chlamydomonas sp. UWO 241]